MRVLTANRLHDGEVVFWAAGAWVERFADAEVFGENPAGEDAESRARSAPSDVVDAYLIDVAPIGERERPVAPVSYRERLRALGPTNKRDHGKQALGGPDIEALQRARGAARSRGRVDLIRRK